MADKTTFHKDSQQLRITAAGLRRRGSEVTAKLLEKQADAIDAAALKVPTPESAPKT
jgi:hypothetical protein